MSFGLLEFASMPVLSLSPSSHTYTHICQHTKVSRKHVEQHGTTSSSNYYGVFQMNEHTCQTNIDIVLQSQLQCHNFTLNSSKKVAPLIQFFIAFYFLCRGRFNLPELFKKISLKIFDVYAIMKEILNIYLATLFGKQIYLSFFHSSSIHKCQIILTHVYASIAIYSVLQIRYSILHS